MSTTRTHFTFRVDTWTPDGESIVEHIASIEDYRVALANLPRRLRTQAGHTHRLAAGCASDRGQSAPARGVQSVRAPQAPGTPVLAARDAERTDLCPKIAR